MLQEKVHSLLRAGFQAWIDSGDPILKVTGELNLQIIHDMASDTTASISDAGKQAMRDAWAVFKDMTEEELILVTAFSANMSTSLHLMHTSGASVLVRRYKHLGTAGIMQKMLEIHALLNGRG